MDRDEGPPLPPAQIAADFDEMDAAITDVLHNVRPLMPPLPPAHVNAFDCTSDIEKGDAKVKPENAAAVKAEENEEFEVPPSLSSGVQQSPRIMETISLSAPDQVTPSSAVMLSSDVRRGGNWYHGPLQHRC